MIKKELYDRLDKYESQLSTAKNCGYARNLTTTAKQELNEIRKEIFGEYNRNFNTACNHCLLTALKELAEPYYEYKSWYEKRWKSKTEQEDGK